MRAADASRLTQRYVVVIHLSPEDPSLITDFGADTVGDATNATQGEVGRYSQLIWNVVAPPIDALDPGERLGDYSAVSSPETVLAATPPPANRTASR
jgi:hypothetical protein